MNRMKNYRDIIAGYSRVGRTGAVVARGFRGLLPGRTVLRTVNGDMATTEEEWLESGAADCVQAECCPLPPGRVARIAFAGFEPKCVKGCTTEVVEATVDAQSEIIGLYIDPSIASAFSILDFRIGRWPALANCHPISASLFSCCDMDENMFSSIQLAANARICLTVKNKRKNQDIEFEATLKVIICEPC